MSTEHNKTIARGMSLLGSIAFDPMEYLKTVRGKFTPKGTALKAGTKTITASIKLVGKARKEMLVKLFARLIPSGRARFPWSRKTGGTIAPSGLIQRAASVSRKITGILTSAGSAKRQAVLSIKTSGSLMLSGTPRIFYNLTAKSVKIILSRIGSVMMSLRRAGKKG